MKKLSIVWLLTLTLPCLAQNATSIKPSDTLYIYFNHGKGQEKFNHQKTIGEILNSSVYYIYFNDNQWSYLSFGFMDVDQPDVKEVKKFLKKNKKKILYAASLRKYELKEAAKIIGNHIHTL